MLFLFVIFVILCCKNRKVWYNILRKKRLFGDDKMREYYKNDNFQEDYFEDNSNKKKNRTISVLKIILKFIKILSVILAFIIKVMQIPFGIILGLGKFIIGIFMTLAILGIVLAFFVRPEFGLWRSLYLLFIAGFTMLIPDIIFAILEAASKFLLDFVTKA